MGPQGLEVGTLDPKIFNNTRTRQGLLPATFNHEVHLIQIIVKHLWTNILNTNSKIVPGVEL